MPARTTAKDLLSAIRSFVAYAPLDDKIKTEALDSCALASYVSARFRPLKLAACPKDRALSDQPDAPDLETRLKAARRRAKLDAPANDAGGGNGKDIGIGARSGIEFVAALAVAGAIGVLVDKWLGTSPFGLLILLFLGFGAGLLNVYRAINGMGYADTYKPLANKPKAIKPPETYMDKEED